MPQYNPTSAFPNPFGGPQAQAPYPMQPTPVVQPAMVDAASMPQDPNAHPAWYKRILDIAAMQQAQQGGMTPPPTSSGGGLVGRGLGIAAAMFGGQGGG